MLRIHFTAEDLAKIRVASIVDPLWEMVLSRARLHERHVPVQFRPWLMSVRASRERMARIRPGEQLLATLAPMCAYFPDFLTPPEASYGVAAGIDAILRTPRRVIRHELRLFAQYTSVSALKKIRALVDGDAEFLASMGETLFAYYQGAIAPYEDQIQAAVDADRAQRARAMLDGGVGGLFESLQPYLRWRPPVLEVDYVVDRDLDLNGRGLRLVPSYFCRGGPVSLANPELPPVLVYPINEDCRWSPIVEVDDRSLGALIGTTRAAILDAVDSMTTTELARKLHTSAASVSRHTAVLRGAGLITTHRDGPAVRHNRTPLGSALLKHHVAL